MIGAHPGAVLLLSRLDFHRGGVALHIEVVEVIESLIPVLIRCDFLPRGVNRLVEICRLGQNSHHT